MDTQAFKRSLHQSDRYNRRGFGSPSKRTQALEKAYQSSLIGS
ncbi:MAG: 4-hydroxy-3-methylbut-2-enyl diphosphate reductase, partial [Prochlorococcus sp.]